MSDFSRKLRGHARFREGAILFNSAEWFEAHEAWETIWLDSSGDEKVFLQGLIQAAAALHLVRLNRLSGARRVFASSIAKLERTIDLAREVIDVDGLLQQLRTRSQSIGSSENAPVLLRCTDENDLASAYEVNGGLADQKC